MKTKVLPLILVALCAALLAVTGCQNPMQSLAKLPPISADSFTYQRKDPLGGATVTATGVKTTTDANGKVTNIHADSLHASETYPQFGISIDIKNFNDGTSGGGGGGGAPTSNPPATTPPASTPPPPSSTPAS